MNKDQSEREKSETENLVEKKILMKGEIKGDRELNLEHFKMHDKDTGSIQTQVVRLSDRIQKLTGHFQDHRHDHHSRRGLLKMVSRRKKLLEYLKSRQFSVYQELLKKLSLRK